MPGPWRLSQDFWNCDSRPDLLPEYLNYGFKSRRSEPQVVEHGSPHQTIYQRLPLIQVPLPVPAIDEQRAIADYLDHETAQIDTLIESRSAHRAAARATTAVVDGVIGLAAARKRLKCWSRKRLGRSEPAHWAVPPVMVNVSTGEGRRSRRMSRC